ncbi:MAG: MBL fold metallo-hydrolase RNA specificity domain-containing protein, partial [Patescibacteria group bacterium]
RYLPDPSSTLLIMGYQAAGSRGRQIQDGAREIEMFGEKIPVRCRVETLEGYSGHPDRDQLVEFVQYSVDALEQVFCIQGEADSALFLVQRIRDYLGIPARAPKLGESFEV